MRASKPLWGQAVVSFTLAMSTGVPAGVAPLPLSKSESMLLVEGAATPS